MNKYLSDEFLEPYKTQKPFPTQLGEITYVRTYSQYKHDEKRREYWWETVARAVEYNIGLGNATVDEAEKLFHNIFNLKQFTSGRTLWSGGGEVSELYPMSNFNCSSAVIDNIEIFGELFYLLLVGSGVGFRALPSDVDKLPKFRQDIEISHAVYLPVEPNNRLEVTELRMVGSRAYINIGDSKEGWKQSLDMLFNILTDPSYKSVTGICLNYDSIRPKGERLKRFGGFASGHQSLKIMFTKIAKLITNNRKNGKLSSMEIIDINNIIGESVVSGGVRRTAELSLIHPDDTESIQMKNKLYSLVDGEWKIDNSILHRQMSNNCIFYDSKPSRDKLHWQFEQMRFSGEPSFLNSEVANKRRDNFKGVNPCFTGDMKLLTTRGYQTFESLASQTIPINLINKDGKISKDCKVWSNGFKKVVEVGFRNRGSLFCTPDHPMMDSDGDRVIAENMLGSRAMPYLQNNVIDDEYTKLGQRHAILYNNRAYVGFNDLRINQQINFVRGYLSVAGNSKIDGRLNVIAPTVDILEQLSDFFGAMGIHGSLIIDKNKPAFRVNNDEGNIKFYNEVGFADDTKMQTFKARLTMYASQVSRVIEQPDEVEVFDFNEPITHWGVVEGLVVHNCGEILLDSRGVCNLTEVNVFGFVEDGKLNKDDLFDAQRLSARVGMRMTLPEFELYRWDIINKRDRLIGCSLTGWQDMVNATNMSKADEVELFSFLKEVTNTEAESYAKELEINTPLLQTTFKPSGTLSLLPSVSSGIHYSHSEFYIRRIRISTDDPLAKTLMELGYNWNPEVGQTVDDMKTIVVDFPIKAPHGKTKHDVSALEQLENYVRAMKHYVEHNVSITITVKEDEWAEVEQYVWEHWDEILAVSFLPLSEAFYQLMPYESITEIQYDALLESLPQFAYGALSKYESGDDLEIDDSECENGICPIR